MSVEVFCLAKKISGPVGIYTIQAKVFQTGEMQRNCTIDASIRAKGRRSDLLEIPPVSCKVAYSSKWASSLWLADGERRFSRARWMRPDGTKSGRDVDKVRSSWNSNS